MYEEGNPSVSFFIHFQFLPSFLSSLFISLCQGHLAPPKGRREILHDAALIKISCRGYGQGASRQDSVITSHPADVMAAPYSAAAVAGVFSILSHKADFLKPRAMHCSSNGPQFKRHLSSERVRVLYKYFHPRQGCQAMLDSVADQL
jgi:hypothetical protein